MFIDEETAAEKLGVSVEEVKRLVRDGVLPGRRTEEGWRIHEKSVDQLRSKYEGLAMPMPRPKAPVLAARPAAPSRLPLSRLVVGVLRIVSWISLLLGFALIAIGVLQNDQVQAILGGAVALVSIAFVLIYDLMRAVFVLHARLQELAGEASPFRARRPD
ncbi:MAG: helix-turn-helix domain-containing protein [Limnochordales bacterium]|nr:helix-turn-helix domain-containing protein [Limnochordales bacterium]